MCTVYILFVYIYKIYIGGKCTSDRPFPSNIFCSWQSFNIEPYFILAGIF